MQKNCYKLNYEHENNANKRSCSKKTVQLKWMMYNLECFICPIVEGKALQRT